MAKNKLDKIIASLLIACVSLLLYLGVLALVFFRDKTVPMRINMQMDYMMAYDILEREYKPKSTMSNEYYKQIVEDDIGLRFYIYKEKNIDGYNGLAFVSVRLIVVDERLDGYEYCVTFAHESIHLKQFISDERWVCYETFKYLYESEELHDVGVWYGYHQILGFYSGEYDISDLIVNYLTSK